MQGGEGGDIGGSVVGREPKIAPLAIARRAHWRNLSSSGREPVCTFWCGGKGVVILVCLALIYLAVKKGFELLLLIPVGFGGLLVNIPVAGMAEGAGILHLF